MPVEGIEEGLRTATLVAGAAYLAWRGHREGLARQRGWSLILAGLLVLALGSVVDLLDEFAAVAAWPDALVAEPLGLVEVFSELVAPLAGTLLLVAGFVRWLPLPWRVAQAEAGLQQANHALAARAAAVETSWQALLANAPDYVLLIDGDGRVAYANRTPAGLTVAQVLGQPIGGFVPDAAQREQMLASIGEALRGGPAATVELDGPGPDGGVAHYACRIAAARMPDGRPAALMLNEDVTAQRRLHRDLVAREALLNETQEIAQVGSWEVDLRTGEQRGTAQARRMHGLGEGEPETRSNLLLHVHPDDRQAVLEGMARAAQASAEVSYRVVLRDGTQRWMHTKAEPRAGADGDPARVVGFTRDVTEERERDAALRASEERFRLAALASRDVVWDHDIATDRLQWGGALRAAFGYDPASLPMDLSAWTMCVHPDDVDRVGTGYAKALEGRDTLFEAEYRFRRADGTYADVVDRALIERDAHGRATRAVGALMDVTESRRAAQEIALRERRYRALTDAAPVPIVETDLAGLVRLWNPAAEALFGWTHQEVFGKPLPMLPPEKAFPAEAHRRHLTDGHGVALPADTVRKDGQRLPTLLHLAAVRDEGGVVVGTVGVFLDLRDRERAEREAREAARLKDMTEFKTQFLNNAAHELATPLTPLKLQLATMRPTLAGKDPAGFELLERNVDRLANLVQDLLDAARLQSGRLPLEVEPVPLSRLLSRVAQSFRAQAQEGGITLGLRTCPEGLSLRCDEMRVEQVLFNLVHNALKFTPRGGQVWLGAEEVGPHVAIAVQDTGVGLSPEQAARLFQPFTQVHDSGRSGGTGLGLYIARGIAEQHGGSLQVASAGQGAGACFTLRLPLAGPPASALRVPHARPA